MKTHVYTLIGWALVLMVFLLGAAACAPGMAWAG
jgi:hypothetical protein